MLQKSQIKTASHPSKMRTRWRATRLKIRQQKESLFLLGLRAAWAIRRAFGYPVASKKVSGVSAVILSYKRTANIKVIVESLLTCEFVDKILVSNNNPELKIASFLKIESPRLVKIDQTERKFANVRFELARDMKGDLFVLIDDDVFLTPQQIRTMCELVVSYGRGPVGSCGHHYDLDTDTNMFKEGELVVSDARVTSAVPVDVIHESYAFSRHQVRKYFEIIETSALEAVSQVRICDDIILSCTGNPPVVAPLGYIYTCKSKSDRSIALHHETGFTDLRNSVFTKIKTALRSSG